MNKKLLSLAVGTALAVGSLGAHADVTINGYMNVSADSINATGGAAGSFISSNASNIVIAGNTDIGNGLKALFSAQTFISMGSDNNPVGAGNYTGSGFTYDQFSNGNTYAGLSGGFGMVAFGRNDSPMKQLGRAVDLFGNEIGDSRNIISGPAGYGFDERPGHTVFYVSPEFAGVTVKAAYTMENTDKNTGTASTNPAQNPTSKAHQESISAVYSQGGLLAGVSYENHSASMYGAPNNTNNENAVRVAASYTFQPVPVRVVALYQHTSDLAGVSGASFNVYGVGASYTFFGNNAIKAQYYDAGTYGAGNNGANMYAVGLTHTFSKNASVYLDYAKTNNDNAAAYSVASGGHGNNIAPTAGNNPDAVSLGMIYTF